MAVMKAAVRGGVVEYRSTGISRLDSDILGAVAFGDAAGIGDARLLHVRLALPGGGGVVELWRGTGPVEQGAEGPIRYAHDGTLLFGILELDERQYDGIQAAAQAAYEAIEDFHRRRDQKHLLRMWNYIGDINRGSGDEERYKQFCLGRSRGFGNVPERAFPAATAVGRRDGLPLLQLCWLAGRQAGQPVENPRQIEAYHYPRQYGPAPPSFCRAINVAGGQLMVSGTASIVGSDSVHGGDLRAQLDETALNLRRVLEAAAADARAPARAALPPGTIIKAYFRDRAAAPLAAARLEEILGGNVRVLALEADICRSELLVEIECVCDYPATLRD
jgi:chorismate lyase/3-hydroxybenzoate synthase